MIFYKNKYIYSIIAIKKTALLHHGIAGFNFCVMASLALFYLFFLRLIGFDKTREQPYFTVQTDKRLGYELTAKNKSQEEVYELTLSALGPSLYVRI